MIDVYGVGFSLLYMTNVFHKENLLKEDSFVELSKFYSSMFNFNPSMINTDIDTLITNYENTLMQIGVLKRLKKRFVNNDIEDETLTNIKNMIKDDIKYKNSSKTISKKLEEFASEDPVPLLSKEQQKTQKIKSCPGTKELNPKTNRCIAKCKDGYVRDDDFKCVKSTRKR